MALWQVYSISFAFAALVLIVGCQSSSPLAKPRIVNGTEVQPPHKYPWIAFLESHKGFVACGGSLLNKRVILTAAHCMDKEGLKPEDLTVNLGVHQNPLRFNESGVVRVGVQKILQHPDYVREGPAIYYDYSLLTLMEEVEFSDRVGSIALPNDQSQQYVGTGAVVAGWGATRSFGEMTDVLMETNVMVLASDKCGLYSKDFDITEEMVCAGAPFTDACTGDS